MKGIKYLALFISLFFSLVGISQTSKCRLIILADMGNEPDEEQQMAHMLMYSNEFDLEGLIAVSGKFLHSEHRLPERQSLYPQLFIKLINGYEKVYENLRKHAEGYPEPDYLKSIVAAGHVGYGVAAIGKGKSNQGSELLIKSFKKVDPRPLYIVVNAGSNTLAQALIEYQATHTKKELKVLLEKIWVFENGAQDDAGAWICANYPDINWLRSNYQTYGYGGPAWAWGNSNDENKGPHTWKPYAYSAIGQHQWALEHVKNHGALSGVYPLRENHEGKLVFIEGGGTIPWLGLVHQGLSDFTKPSWGGWSGRFSDKKVKNVYSRHNTVKETEVNYGEFEVYTEVSDRWTDPGKDTIYQNLYVPVWRWRQAYFDDFKCRMDWCLASYENANHHPIASVNGDKTEKIHVLKVASGEKLVIDGSGSSDPDGDNLNYNWWIYNEAGNYTSSDLKIQNQYTSSPTLYFPPNSRGKTIHLIFELSDDNSIGKLTDYRRIIIEVD
jgi:hypothetical protein